MIIQCLTPFPQTGYTNPDAATTIGTTNYTYDQAGNLLTSGNGSATTSYTWDYRHRMTDTFGTLGGATTTHYAYDSSDQRVQMDVKNGGSTTTTKYFNYSHKYLVAFLGCLLSSGAYIVILYPSVEVESILRQT